MTHGTNFTTTNEIVLEWTAPSASAGDLVISATLVRDFQNFWVGQNVPLTASQAAADGAVVPARQVRKELQ